MSTLIILGRDGGGKNVKDWKKGKVYSFLLMTKLGMLGF